MDRLDRAQAQKLLRAIAADSEGIFLRPHCRAEAKVSRLDEVDVLRAVRGGRLQPGYQRDEEWRYEVVRRSITVVVCFVSFTEVHAVTVWRNH